MDVQGYINAMSSPQFKQWRNAHPNCSYQDENNIIDLINSYEFQNWLSHNSSGTVDQYFIYLQNLRNYRNSPAYRIECLEEEIVDLNDQIEELQSSVRVKDELYAELESSCNNYKFSTILFGLLSAILLGYVFYQKFLKKYF